MNILLVIDLQKEFYVKGEYERLIQYIKDHREKYDKVIATVFKNYPYKYNNFHRKLQYNGCQDAGKTSIEFPADVVYVKDTYAAPVDLLCKHGDHITVIGCDTDACVLATLFRLFDAGYDFEVLEDYCYSSGGRAYSDAAREIIQRNIQKEEPE